MLDGKKGVAQKIVYGAFAKIEEKAGKPAIEVFEEAMNNIMPVLEVKAIRWSYLRYLRFVRKDVRLWPRLTHTQKETFWRPDKSGYQTYQQHHVRW